MATGTTVSIFAKNIHKSNATTVQKAALKSLAICKENLIALACSTPSGGIVGLQERRMEVADAIDEIELAFFELTCAESIIMYPEDCEDELGGEV